jgi:hypothetical protein
MISFRGEAAPLSSSVCERVHSNWEEMEFGREYPLQKQGMHSSDKQA